MQVQSIIGAKNATAYDITAACSGFVVALISAATYIRTGLYRNIIIIGADALSRYTDWRDRCKHGKLSLRVLVLMSDQMWPVQRVPKVTTHSACSDVHPFWRWNRGNGADSAAGPMRSAGHGLTQ